MLLIFAGDANAGIATVKTTPVRHRKLRRNPHLAVFGEFNRVGDEVAEDLRDFALVRDEWRKVRRLVEDEGDVGIQQQRAQHPAKRAEQVANIEFGRAHYDLAGFHFGEVEQVVDQSERFSAALRMK